MYYPVFKNIRKILEELHILRAPDKYHRKVFTDIPRIGFKNGKSLKDHLVRSVLPKMDVAGNSGSCGGKRPSCELCKLMKNTITFEKRNSDKFFHIYIHVNDLNLNTKQGTFEKEFTCFYSKKKYEEKCIKKKIVNLQIRKNESTG